MCTCAGNVVDNRKQLQHDAAVVDDHIAADVDAAHVANAPAHDANVANVRHPVDILAHQDNRADIIAAGGPRQQHLAVDNGVGKVDGDREQADDRQEQVVDRAHGAAMLQWYRT